MRPRRRPRHDPHPERQERQNHDQSDDRQHRPEKDGEHRRQVSVDSSPVRPRRPIARDAVSAAISARLVATPFTGSTRAPFLSMMIAPTGRIPPPAAVAAPLPDLSGLSLPVPPPTPNPKP